jgi:hypothetical protein
MIDHADRIETIEWTAAEPLWTEWARRRIDRHIADANHRNLLRELGIAYDVSGATPIVGDLSTATIQGVTA